MSDPEEKVPAENVSAESEIPDESAISEQKSPEVKTAKTRDPITKNRMIVWALAGGFGLYMIGTGLVGILTK